MANENMMFAVPGKFSNKQLISLLASGMDVDVETLDDVRRYHMDTFDWRLYREGMVLEAEVRGNSCTLLWRELGTGRQIMSVSMRKLPKCASDFKNAGLQKKLKQIIGSRTLLTQAYMHGVITRYCLLDDEAKCVMRVDRRSDTLVASGPNPHTYMTEYLCLFPYRGYEDIYSQRYKKLSKKLPLKPVKVDPLLEAASALGVKPGEYTARPVFALEAEQPASAALAEILGKYQENMLCNVEGARQDVDPEHLHDFLVALRRISSVLQNYSSFLPAKGVDVLVRDLKWIESASVGIRDLDIFMTLFDEFSHVVDDEHREALKSLYSYLDGEKRDKIRSMRVALESTRFLKLMNALEEYVADCKDGEHSRQGVGEAASGVILKLYKKLRQEAKELSSSCSAKDILGLFQTSKQLGYHMDMFQCAYPESDMKDLLRSKRKLQKWLNRFRDMDLQHQRLKSYKAGMVESQGRIENSIEALEQLIDDRKSEKRSARNRALDQIDVFTSKKMNKQFKAMFSSKVGRS